MNKLTGQVFQHTTKHIRFSSDDVLKQFGIDPDTHEIQSISRQYSQFHSTQKMDQIEIVVVERPDSDRRVQR